MAIAVYFVVPAGIMSRMRIDIPTGTDHLIDGEPNIITDGNLDLNRHYVILELFAPILDYEVGDRFTGITANVTGRGVVREVSSIYPLKYKMFEMTDCGVNNAGRHIAHVVLKRHFIREVRRFTRLDDITSAQSLLLTKLQNAYIGRTPQDVFDRFPEMEEVAVVGESEILRFKYNTWSFEV